MALKSFKKQQLNLLPVPSKPIIYKSHPSESNAALLLVSIPFSSSSEPKQPINPKLKLTQEELTEINLLIPRLCLSNHLATAFQLTTAAILTNPPPKSLSLSILIHSLTSQPDLTQPMSLLTRLRHTPSVHSHLTPITTMLITSYLKKGRHRDALKVYSWVLRPGSPCEVEAVVYGVLVDGFCRCGLVLEALRILRDMLGVDLVPGEGLRKRVFRSLLREARVKEAKELDEALGYVGDGGERVKKALSLLDQMIASWTD